MAPETLAVAAVSAHVAYYTFVIGGDHFEYRVYSHLVPLLAVSGLWLAARSFASPPQVVAWLALALAMSWPIASR